MTIAALFLSKSNKLHNNRFNIGYMNEILLFGQIILYDRLM